MKIVFFGTPDFAVACLDSLVKNNYNIVGVVTMPDKPAHRGQRIRFSPIKQYAIDNKLNLLQPTNLKDADFLKDLNFLKADINIVVAFRMVPKEVYAMPPLGSFNLHASLLPKYRGAAPIHWAIINGEKETGLTTFLLNNKIDEGEIILQEKISIDRDETAGQLHDRMKIEGGNLIIKTLEALNSEDFKTISQNEIKTEPSLAPKIFKETTLIPWHKKGQEIVNFVRGMSPLPCATTVFFDEKLQKDLFLKVYKVEFNEFPNNKTIGQVEVNLEEGISVYCSDGKIELLDLQQSGRKRMSVNDFLRGNRLEGSFVVKK